MFGGCVGWVSDVAVGGCVVGRGAVGVGRRGIFGRCGCVYFCSGALGGGVGGVGSNVLFLFFCMWCICVGAMRGVGNSGYFFWLDVGGAVGVGIRGFFL